MLTYVAVLGLFPAVAWVALRPHATSAWTALGVFTVAAVLSVAEQLACKWALPRPAGPRFRHSFQRSVLSETARLIGDETMDRLLGRSLGPYELGELLGSGSWGAVYRSVHRRLNQPRAADSALIDLGLPPGFAPETADLDALVQQSPHPTGQAADPTSI